MSEIPYWPWDCKCASTECVFKPKVLHSSHDQRWLTWHLFQAYRWLMSIQSFLKKIVSIKLSIISKLLSCHNLLLMIFTCMYQRTSDSSIYLSSDTGTLVSSLNIQTILFICSLNLYRVLCQIYASDHFKNIEI
jgi:hypothetical protein